MAATRRWSDLSQRNRRLLLAAAAVEGVLKAAALADLARRPASEVRGPKWAWVPALTVVGSAGLLPLAYLAFGRREGSAGVLGTGTNRAPSAAEA